MFGTAVYLYGGSVFLKGGLRELRDRLPGMTLISLAITVLWLALGATGAFAVERLVSVLVIACPHALGLAVPLVAAISTSLGAQSGLLIRDRRGLEEARNLTTVVFDKTGTLTRGGFRVVDVATDGSLSGTDALLDPIETQRRRERPRQTRHEPEGGCRGPP